MNVIELKDISKKYFLQYRHERSLKGRLLNLFKGTEEKEFWALKEINLSVQKGETLGVIGKNGSGKTTLLKLICGVTKPTEGSIKVNGRVVALLELGAGFQSDLTGRENIYLNGSILGLSRKEIQKNLDSIVDFADIGDFIDAPVRTYSAGMYLRLGFAITVLLKSDILLIDEVLAIGDEIFQKKCLNKIKEFKKENRTIIFVSHNLNIIRQFCERGILIDKGNIICDGKPEEVINRYFALMDKKEIVWLSKEIEIRGVYFKNSKGEIVNTFKTGEGMRIIIEYFAHKKVSNPVFGIGVYKDNVYLIGPNTRDDNYKIDYVEGGGALEYKIRSIPFREGSYKIGISIHDIDETHFYDYYEYLSDFQVVPGTRKFKYGLISIDGYWVYPII